MIQIFPFGSDDEFAVRCNAAVTIVAHAAKRVSGPLHPGLQGPFEQLMLVWEFLPEDLIASFTRAYGAWDNAGDRPVHLKPQRDEIAIDACRYAAAIVSLVPVQLQLERCRLEREQQDLVEELRRRTQRR